jgi:hypothetical protein
MRYAIAIAQNLSLVLCLFATESSADDSALSRESVIKYQLHIETIARSGVGEFDYICKPTSDENISSIKGVIEENFTKPHPAEYKRFVTSEEGARNRCYSAKWFRDGIRDRLEYYPLGKIGLGEPTRVLAFDGTVVRELSSDGDEKQGIISSILRGHWDSAPAIEPFNLLLRSFGRPWSKVFEDSPTFSVKPLAGDATQNEVEVSDKLSGMQYVIRLDNESRIIQRDVYLQLPQDKKSRLYERHLFSDWEDLPAGGGEMVSFPKKCQLQYCVGMIEGRPVIYTESEITFRTLTLNPKLADSLFTIDFPSEVKITDRLQGFGAPNSAKPEVTKLWSRWPFVFNVIVCALLFFVLATRFFFRRHSLKPKE